MKADWETFINFSEDIFIPINFFSESTESTELENTISPNNLLKEPIEQPIELPIELPIEPLIELQLSCTDNLNTTSYQYKLCIGNNFND